MSTKKYPYQETLIKKLPGEIWRTVPGFTGYYQASSKGRVRSMDRIIPHPRLNRQFVRGRILKQSVAKNKNIKTGEPMIDLRVTLNVAGVATYFNTRRLIFQTFKKDIDFERDGLYVINTDGNGYDCSVQNLSLVTKSFKQERVFNRGRHDSYLKTADRTKWKNPYGGAIRRKPITQFKGNRLIKAFNSISEASLKTGFDEKEIIRTAKGKRKDYKGYRWVYSKKN